jgi:hypothetical protein
MNGEIVENAMRYGMCDGASQDVIILVDRK